MDPEKLNLQTDIDQLDEPPLPLKPKLRGPASGFKRFITSKWTWAILSLLVAAGFGAWFVQPSRLWLVNSLRLTTPLTVTARTVAEPGQPSALLKNASVTINGSAFTTNDQGVVETTVAYGTQTIEVAKPGYQTVTVTDFYDFDPFFNKLSPVPTRPPQEVMLKSVGMPVKFKAVDWLTDQPITSGQFSVGDVIATPNSDGLVSLKAPPSDTTGLLVKTTFNGAYVDREFQVELGREQTELFVPAGTVYFVDQQGVSASQLNGTVRAFIAPSSNESAAARFAASPSGAYAAFASKRDGALKLYIVTMATGKMVAIDQAASFQFVDWIGDRLVYVATGQPQRLATVDAAQAQKTDLAQADSFENVHVSLGRVVYIAHGGADSPLLKTVKAGGGTEQTLGTKITHLSQTEPHIFTYQIANATWHTYNANTGVVASGGSPKSFGRSFLQSANPAGQLRLGVERADGKTTIFTKSVATGEEKVLHSANGLTGPVYWASNTVIVFGHQSALYALATTGGPPKKITHASLPSDTSFHFY